MTIFGTSLRTVERYLTEDEKTPPRGGVSPKKVYSQSLQKLKQCQAIAPTTPQEHTLAKKLPEVIQLLEKILESEP
jgi:hypothetical protein